MSITSPKNHRRLATLAAVGAVAVLVPGIAAAQSGFGDVPSDYVHADGIDYVADNDITAGCGDGSDYCPNDPVTRGQMATFLHRASGNAPGVAPSVAADTAESAQTAATAETAAMADAVEGFTPINAVLDFGETVELISHGDVSFVAECIENDAGGDRILVVARSSVDGWAATQGGPDLLATDEQVMFSNVVTTGVSSFSRSIDDGVAMSPSGDYLALQGETLALGINTLGADCLVAGVAFSQQVALP